MKRSAYSLGRDILGEGPVFGPITVQDLANVDRPLNKDEQAAVDAYQSSQADQMQATEEKKGGPKAATISVTSKGAIIARPRTVKDDDPGMPTWQIAALAAGGSAVLLGIVMLLVSPGGGRRMAPRYAR